MLTKRKLAAILAVAVLSSGTLTVPVAAEAEPSVTEAATEAIVTEVPETEVVETEAVTTEAPETEVVETEAVTTEAPETEVVETEAVTTEAPETEVVETEAVTTEASETEVAETEAVTTEAPETEVVETEAVTTEASETESIETDDFEIIEEDNKKYKTTTLGDYTIYYELNYNGTAYINLKINKYNGFDSELILPDKLNSYNITGIGGSAFSGCTSLTKVTFSKYLNYVNYRAFANCNNLISVTLNDGLSYIYEEAFYKCQSLTNVIIPDSVALIDVRAFYGCNSLTNIKIGKGVKTIGFAAFAGCNSLKTVTIPANVTEIDPTAFAESFRLTDINVDANNEYYTSVDGVLFTKDMKTLVAYPAGKTQTSYTIPSTVTTIGSYAFLSCDNLKTIKIPNSVTVIDEYSFGDCTFTEIVIPDSVTAINQYAFNDCTYLKSIVIPDSIISINTFAFRNCTSLSSIVIGSGVASIGDYAFDNCTALKNVYYISSEKYWNYISIGSNNSALTNAARTYNYIPAPKFTGIKVSTGNKVTLTWSEVSQATSYRVYRATSSVSAEKTYLGAVTNTTFTDTTAPAGKKCYYFVATYNSSSKNLSPYSDSWVATLPAAPASPKGVKAVSGGGNATITWDAVNGATSYRVYRSTSLTGTKTRVSIRTSTYYIDKNATTGLTYYYWIQSYNTNTGLSSVYSANSSVKIVKTFNSTPVIRSASVLSTSVTLKWDVIPGATSYRIYRRNSKGGRELIASQSMTEYKDTGLTKGKSYMYEIRAYSATTKALTPYSRIRTVRTIAAPTITGGNTNGKIIWNNNLYATSYRVYRADSLTGAKKFLKAVNATTYTDTTAVSGKTYYYFVAAYDNTTGTLSAYSNAKAIKIS